MPRAKAPAPSAPENTEAQAATVIPTEAQPLPMKLDVRINSIKPNGSIRATASVNMNDCFAVKNIKVMDGKNGMFVSMPSYKSPTTGEYKEHCFPVTKEFRDQLNSAVIGAYQQALAQSQQTALQGIPQPEAQDQTAPEPEAPQQVLSQQM